nr:PREDICTED: putative defensin-like protein 228 [Raphanus sativus]
MKSSILFIVSCVVLLLVLSYPEGEAKAASNRCHARRHFPGKCGNNALQSCLRDIKKINKISHIYDQCSKCEDRKKPSGVEDHLCTCSHPSSSPCL